MNKSIQLYFSIILTVIVLTFLLRLNITNDSLNILGIILTIFQTIFSIIVFLLLSTEKPKIKIFNKKLRNNLTHYIENNKSINENGDNEEITYSTSSYNHYIKSNEMDMNLSFVIQLLNLFLFHIKKGYSLNSDDYVETFENTFQDQDSFKRLSSNWDDDIDCFRIYIKQFRMIFFEMRKQEKLNAILKKEVNEIYGIIFKTFWYFTRWEDLFPSDPEFSRKLFNQKDSIIEILLTSEDTISLQDLCNNFFEKTGITEKHNLFAISFMDFYIFTWLKHFGIINYLSEEKEVTITLSSLGKTFLQNFYE